MKRKLVALQSVEGVCEVNFNIKRLSGSIIQSFVLCFTFYLDTITFETPTNFSTKLDSYTYM